jgi:hypothetical protein
MTHVPLSMTKTFLFYPQRHDFSKSGAVLPQELLSKIVAESLENYWPNGGGSVDLFGPTPGRTAKF